MWLEIVKTLLLWSAIIVLLWAPLGRWLVNRSAKGVDSSALAVAFGMGAWGTVTFLLGLLGGLHVVLILSAAVALFFCLRLHHHLRPSWAFWKEFGESGPGLRCIYVALAALCTVYFLLVLGCALAPELSFDALNVHLPYAREAASSHRLVFSPNNWSSAMPALPLMSYVTAFLLSGVMLAKLFNTLCYFVCGGVVYFFARRWWSTTHGMVCAALFWSSPVALYEATTALIDLPLALYSAIAVFSLLEWTRQGERTFLWLSAASLGLAFGCKYHAAFWILPFACILIWHALRVQDRDWTEVSTLLLKYSLVVALLFAPWMIRAWYLTGNPVFPLANNLFRSPYFTPAMETAARAVYESQGVGRSMKALVQLPWTVTFHPGRFRGTLGVIFFVGVALALFRTRAREVRYGLFLSAAYFYAWALTAQEIRYLLPLSPLLAALATSGVLGWRSSFRSGATGREFAKQSVAAYAGLAIPFAATFLSFPSIYPRLVKEWTYWHSYKSPFPYLLGKESAADYVRRDVPSIDVYDFINRTLTRRDRILLLNDHCQFCSRVPTLYSFTVEAEEILLQRSEAGVLGKLKESGITHVLLNYNGIAPLPGVPPREGVYFFLDREFQGKYLEPVHSKNNVVLYRVRVA